MNMVGKPATPETLAEFARRKQLYIRHGYIPSLVASVFAILPILFTVMSEGLPSPLLPLGMFIGIFAFGYNFYARNKWYRCPVCEAPIMSYSEGENLNPDACHKCCTRLTP
jgi:hypothetical protein